VEECINQCYEAGDQLMVKRSIVYAALLTICGALGSVTDAAAQASPEEGQWALIQSYCVGCHNSKARTANLAFDSMSPENITQDAKTWEAVIRKLRGGLMPPPGSKRPEGQAVAGLISWLEKKIDTAATDSRPGRVAMRRFNRREYANVIRDLVGLNVDVEALLPVDDVEGHFDNDAATLQVSPAFVDQYVSAARLIARQAVGDAEAPPVTATYGDVANMVISLPPRGDPGTGRQQHHIKGMPFGTRGGFSVEHVFPVDGEYELNIGDMALAREVPRMEFENTVIALLDGKEFYRTNIGGEKDHKAIDQLLDPAVEEINGRLKKIRFQATAGQHVLTVTFLHRSFAESDERTRTAALEGGQERIQAAHVLQIRGPLTVTGISDSASRKKIFICKPERTADETACARKIINNFAQRAFRRPVTDEDLNPLMAFYKAGHANGGFDRGVREVVSAVLASPHFLYRVESADPAGRTRTLSDVELASRLSFFLWSTLPDEELLNLAIKSQLSKPDVLARQVRRMLADARAKSLVDDFAFQWLNLKKLDEIAPDGRLFSHASGLLDVRELFKEELRLFIDSVLRSDRSVVDLLTADYTFLNERLAMHYGIETVKGARFRRVTLENTARHGLLGKGAILNLTANPNRTSPVLRGAWILERLMGTPPAPPPPNVEALAENRGGGRALTVRQRIEQHRSKPGCMGCHGVMDPLGFALENFDTVGQFRTQDGQNPIDTSGVLPDGTPLKGPEDLRRALASRPDQFVQALSENLLNYALGRSIDHRDMPAVRKIVHGAEAGGYRFESIVLGIVSSDAFRKREAPAMSQASIK
jgi:mono/diheme cytochrome c family protein